MSSPFEEEDNKKDQIDCNKCVCKWFRSYDILCKELEVDLLNYFKHSVKIIRHLPISLRVNQQELNPSKHLKGYHSNQSDKSSHDSEFEVETEQESRKH
jgi:hypothetical protein